MVISFVGGLFNSLFLFFPVFFNQIRKGKGDRFFCVLVEPLYFKRKSLLSLLLSLPGVFLEYNRCTLVFAR